MGKYESKNKKSAPRRKKKGMSTPLVIFLAIVMLLLVGLIVLMLSMKPGEAAPIPTGATTTAPTASDSQPQSQGTENAKLDAVKEIDITVNERLKVTDIGSYTGVYMEDGTDEVVSGVLMMVVTNTGDELIQLAELEMTVGGETAHFKLTTLPAGASAVLLEQERKSYDKSADYSTALITADNMAVPLEALSLQEDKLKIQVADGVINVTNISGEDISGEVCIYYKNSADDIYYGAITYVARIKEGIQDGEIRQIMASHFNQPGSTIMFVTIGA